MKLKLSTADKESLLVILAIILVIALIILLTYDQHEDKDQSLYIEDITGSSIYFLTNPTT